MPKSGLLDVVKLGDTLGPHTRTVTQADVRVFADLTGDAEPIHVDEEYARRTEFGGCIVHGLHLLSMVSDGLLAESRVGPNVSYGYDRIRLIRPIFVGETFTTRSEVIEKHEDRNTVVVEEKCFSEQGDLAMIANHIYKFI